MGRVNFIVQLCVLLFASLSFVFYQPVSAQSSCVPSDPPGEFAAPPETETDRSGDIVETQRLTIEDIGDIQSLTLSPDGLFVVTQGEHGLHIINPTRNSILYTICKETVNVALTPDGRTLVLIDEDIVLLWDVYSGEIVAEFEQSWTDVAFTPDGLFMVVREPDGTASVRDVVGLDIRYTIDDVEYLAASPAGDFLALVTDSEVQILDLVSGDSIVALDVNGVNMITFNRSGRWLATVSKVVTLWDVETWEAAVEFDIEAADISFDPLDEFIAMTSDDGLTLWELETGTVIDQMECDKCHAILFHHTGIIASQATHLIFAEFSP